jgi:hypothetical protein
MEFAVGQFVAQVLQEGGRFWTKKSQGLPLHGHFQGRPDETDLVNRLAWPDNDMDMLGHDDVGPQSQVETATGRIEGSYDPGLRAAAAGKCQFVSMAWLVVTFVSSSVAASHIRTIGWAKQAFAGL